MADFFVLVFAILIYIYYTMSQYYTIFINQLLPDFLVRRDEIIIPAGMNLGVDFGGYELYFLNIIRNIV